MKSKGILLNSMANQYDLMAPSERSRLRRKQIDLIDLQEGESVLDVGCGTGALTVLAKMTVGEKGSVSGADIAANMIKKGSFIRHYLLKKK